MSYLFMYTYLFIYLCFIYGIENRQEYKTYRQRMHQQIFAFFNGALYVGNMLTGFCVHFTNVSTLQLLLTEDGKKIHSVVISRKKLDLKLVHPDVSVMDKYYTYNNLPNPNKKFNLFSSSSSGSSEKKSQVDDGKVITNNNLEI